jgi:hypothetical protein
MSPLELVRRCNEAMRLGTDFPTLWHTVIKDHAMVVGVPVQRLEGNSTYLEIPLSRGDWLVIHIDRKSAELR